MEDVYIVGRKINELNNLKLNTTNITACATALKGLNAKQAELVLSIQGLTVAQKQAILSQAELLGTTGKLTTAELEAILVTKKRNRDQAEALLINTGLITSETAETTATNIVTAAKLKELVATGKLTQAEANLIAAKAGVTLANQKESASLLTGIGAKIKGTGTALKGLGTGILTIAQAHPVITGITAALALCGGAALVNKIKQEKAAKATKEAYEEAKNAIDEINNTHSTNASQTKDIAKEYAELAQGVDLLTNKNEKLSTEKYERFLELSTQLSKLYPSLTKNFDDNGVAILDLSGDVDTIVGSLDDLIERQRVLANQEIMEHMPDLFAGYSNNVTDLEKQKENAKKTRDKIQQAYDTISNYGIYTAFDTQGNAKDENDDPVALKLGQYIDLLEKLGITAKQVNLKDSMGQIIGYKLELDYGGNIPNISGIYDAYVSQFNKASDDLKYAEQQLDAEKSFINQYLNTWLQTEFSYNQVEDAGLKQAIQETLFNFDWNSLPEGIDKNDWEAVSEYLRRNVLFSINNIDDTDVSQALTDIYTSALTSGELLNAISKVQEYFGEEHPISVALAPKVKDVQPIINSVRDLLKGTDFDDKVGELSLDDLKIATDLDIPLDSIESWEKLLELIEEVKSETFNNKTAISIPDIFSLKDAEDNATALSNLSDQLSEVESAYNTCLSAKEEYDEQGYLSVDTLQKVLSLGDEYLQYLFDEEGNVRLDADAFQQLAQARINDMEAQALSNLAENISQITNEAAATEYLTQKQNDLASSYADVAAKKLLALRDVDGFDDSKALQDTYNSFKTQYDQIKKLFANTRKSLSSTYTRKSVSKSSATKATTDEDAKKKTKDYIESYMKFQKQSLESGRIDYNTYCNSVSNMLKSMYQDGKISAQDYHDYVGQMLETQLAVYKKVLSAVTRRFDKEIDSINDVIDGIEKQNDALKEQKSLMESAIDAVVSYYDSLIASEQQSIDNLEAKNDSIQEQLDKYDSLISVADKVYGGEQKSLEEQQTLLQDKIDALNDENNALDLQYRKEQALIALHRAQTQRTKKVFNGTEFVYDTDKEAIREAQKNLQDIKTEELISDLEKERNALQESIDELQKYRDALGEISDAYERLIDEQNTIDLLGNDYKTKILGVDILDWEKLKDRYVSANKEMADNTLLIDGLNQKIDIWDKEKEQWSSLTQFITDNINEQAAIHQFGADWEQQINEGRFVAYDDFKNRYLSIENQINDNTQLIESYNQKIEYYESLKSQWANIADVYEQSVEDQYAAMILGQNWESEVLSGRIDTLNSFRNNYVSIQQAIADAAWNSANAQIKAAQEAAKASSGTPQASPTVTTTNSKQTTTSGGGGTSRSLKPHVDIKRAFAFAYASGTDNARKGVHLVSEHEQGDEIIVKNNKSAVVAHGEQLYPFEGGETVIKASETEKILENTGNLVPLEGITFGKGKNAVRFTQEEFMQRLQSVTPSYSSMVQIPYFQMPQLDFTVTRNEITPVVQNINLTLPNVTNDSGYERIKKELKQMQIDAYQFAHRR